MKRPARNPIADTIRTLSDEKLRALVRDLAFNTALEQSMLHRARLEIRRRKRQATKSGAGAAR